MKILSLPFYELIRSQERYPQYFSDGDYWLCVIVIIILSLCALVLGYLFCQIIYSEIDWYTSTKKSLKGTVIDRFYRGEMYSSGAAIVPNSGGVGVGIVSASSRSEEEFIIFVRADKVYKINVDLQQFYLLDTGDKIGFNVLYGGMSNKELKAFLL